MGDWIPYFDLVQLSLEGSLTVVLTRNLYTLFLACPPLHFKRV